MLHVILVHYTAPLEAVEAVTPAHREWLDIHYRSGLFIVSGPREPRTGGLILAQGESPEQLLEVMQDDPFYKAGVAEYEVIAFRPVKRGRMIELSGVPLTE
ncbi:YciI family protein [Deinococcus lacus]|uniref:YciI family protein n=1 Tax=Deinococcus lacus TaxID=392561 RepID=A0ABW1YBI4_9DEIO